ncbi:MAG: alpha/beta fold hydrolase [Chloroflexota bacterium]
MSETAGLYVRETGPAEAPTILFLHGAGVSGRLFLPALAHLADYHCLVPDLPEHGRSREVPLSLADTVRRLGDLVRERAAEGRAHVVGVSWGGVLAQALMAAQPEMVERVVLSGSTPRLSAWLVALNALNEPVLHWLNPQQKVNLFLLQFGLPASQSEHVREDLVAFAASSFGRVNRTYLQVETPRGEWPALVLVGEKETEMARHLARRLVAALPGASGRLVPGLGHLWALQEPALFAAVVRAWLEEAPLPDVLRPLS